MLTRRLQFITLLLFIYLFPLFGSGQPFPLNSEKLKHAREVEQEATLKNDSHMLAEAYYLYGKAYHFAGDLAASQGYFFKSVAILEPLGDSFELGRIYCRLAENPRLLNTQEGIKYVRLALGVFRRIGSLKGQVTAYGLLGQFYNGRGQQSSDKVALDSALQCFKKVESLGVQLNDTVSVGEANLQMAQFYGLTKPEAVPLLEKALRFLSATRGKRAVMTTLLNLAEAYLNSGHSEKAFSTLVRAQKIYKQNKVYDFEFEKGLAHVMAKYYENTRKLEEALEKYKEFNQKQLFQFDKEKDEAFLRLQTEYETKKKEALLELLTRELRLNHELLQWQRNFIIITTVLLLFVTALSVLFFRVSRKNRRTSLKNEYLVREQNHRVKNNLQMISSLLSIQARLLTDSDARGAIQESRLRVESMAIIQRKLYDGAHLTEVFLPDFISELSEAVLQACGYAKAKQSYLIDPIHLDVDRTTSLGLILTELVINACKYAFPENEIPSLLVECRQTGDEITLVVQDNGPGLPAMAGRDSDGKSGHFGGNTFGMQLLELQVSQLYGESWFESEEGAIFTMKFKN
jgi:two-component system, sensor histidine kinase PdtaS